LQDVVKKQNNVECEILGTNLCARFWQKEKFTFLFGLCSRQPGLHGWFNSVDIKFSETTQLLLYPKSRFTLAISKKRMRIVLDMKEELAKIIKKRNDLAEKYSNDLKQLIIFIRLDISSK
jgi:hypothetical protein